MGGAERLGRCDFAGRDRNQRTTTHKLDCYSLRVEEVGSCETSTRDELCWEWWSETTEQVYLRR